MRCKGRRFGAGAGTQSWGHGRRAVCALSQALQRSWPPRSGMTAHEIADTERAILDTERPLDETLAQLEARLRTWPRGLNA